MRPIYSFTLKDLISSKDNSENQNYKFIVIKEHNYKLKKIIKNQNITIEEVDGFNYEQSTKDFLFFKIEESKSKKFQEYLKAKLAEFLIDNKSIEKESIKNFLKYLEVDQAYHFDAVTTIEKEDKILIETISNSPPLTPKLPRPKSLNHAANNNDTISLQKTFLSQQSLSNNNSSEITFDPQLPAISSNLSSSHNSIDSQKSFETAERAQLIDSAQKIRSFFTEKEHNNNLVKMERHGSNIKNSYFNGNKKSEILSEITNLAADLRDSCKEIISKPTAEGLVNLDKKFSKFKDSINDKQNLETLSRYRGFSPFKCLATLWGGGKVKSFEYVEQLREQVGSLANDLAALRPTM